MKAVILVGGLGTRLRPLTCNTPKPMLPLVNQPFIEHMIGTLRDQGITEVILAVQYLAERFRDTLGDGSRLGVKVQVVEEPEPRGTCGAVKNVEHLLDGTTFVFNGDVMTDLDLQAMLAFHREHGSKLTIALTPVEDPTAFGLVETDAATHRIKSFVEKPKKEEVTTNLINAGTYILEPELLRYAPKDEFYMFERGLFPAVLENGDPMYGFPSNAYWTDIGKPSAYLEVHHDILMGKARYAHRGTQIADGVWADGEVHISPDAELRGPIVLGAGVRIAAGATIIGPTVIGAESTVANGALLQGALVWDHTEIGANAKIINSTVGRHNTIGAKSIIDDGAVVSDNCSLGAENTLARGIRLWPGTSLGDKAVTF